MSGYTESACCGSMLDSICDPLIWRMDGLRVEYFCSEPKCLADAFGRCIDEICDALNPPTYADYEQVATHGVTSIAAE